MLVLFDSVWDPNPQLGKQRPPRPGVHNSGWLQSPGAKALADPAEHARLEAYVRGVVGAFARDENNYDSPTEFEKRINWLKRYNRPLICTEYMARGNGSFFIGSLPVARVHDVGMINLRRHPGEEGSGSEVATTS